MAVQEMFGNKSYPSGKYLFEETTHGLHPENSTQSNAVNSSFHPITTFIEMYAIPVITVFGLIGNTIASAVFLQKPLRNSSCSLFLAARGVSDNGFLSTLIMIWISRTFRLQLGTVNGSCRVIIFLSYVCGCMSAWLVVFVTVENYIRICRPFLVKRICTIKVAKICVGILCINSVSFYNFPFWAMSPDNCFPYGKLNKTVQAFIYIDIVITLVLPLICIAVFMSAILCALIKSYDIRKRLNSRAKTKKRSPVAKVTNMLLAVTLTFFCLCLPSHVNRIRLMLTNNEGSKVFDSLLQEAIQQITLVVYYLSLSANIVVYIIFGSKFRKVLITLFTVTVQKAVSLRRDIAENNQYLTIRKKDIQSFQENTDVKRNISVSL